MINIVDKEKEERIPPILRLGFRPLFLLAGIYAVFSICTWVWLFTSGSQSPLNVPAIWWHAHEMLFGVAMAVVAGFLMTAVQTWTGVKGTSGGRLAFIVMLWIAARVLFWTDTPLSIIALVDTAFLVLTGWEVGYRVVITKRWRNLFFIPMLLVAISANLASYATVKGMPPFSANALWQAMLWWFMILISIMGGRVIPFFTAKRFQLEAPKPILWLEMLAILPLVMLAVISFFPLVPTWFNASLLWVAGIAQCIRLYRWQGVRSFGEPLVWSLHLFYLALPVGLIAKALYIGNAWISHSLIHLFAMGTLAGVVLAMIARVSMGHTGRAIYQGPSFSFAYFSLVLATLVRVLGPIVWPEHLQTWVVIAGIGWSMAFGGFVVCFGPMLIKARVDGHPG
ncbi:short-chain dehydrogenase [Enterovibrio norvegicus FF-162]|uniref:Short-chain dehydrogenase n=1 Tax=Enterovibrio norvegicus FF-454 TaxID=1185651 RepID=A0A1E5BXT2_9GAMM|nr:NnrS family protein [Enterovibrio norvegicus]OEE58096.1 short-chain dehydrogenase [Enterovibrio norvegicus FF-454]OEE76733.1 short-chain dehydrogenase [Enterovibrio norvegicus FF-162]